MKKIEIVDRETRKIVKAYAFETEQQEDSFWFWWGINGDPKRFYIREVVENDSREPNI